MLAAMFTQNQEGDSTSTGVVIMLKKNLTHSPEAAPAHLLPDHARLLDSSKLASLTESQQHKNKSAEK